MLAQLVVRPARCTVLSHLRSLARQQAALLHQLDKEREPNNNGSRSADPPDPPYYIDPTLRVLKRFGVPHKIERRLPPTETARDRERRREREERSVRCERGAKAREHEH